MKENMIVITDTKIFCFNFDFPKEIDENLMHNIEFFIKSNESLAENKIKKTRLNNYCQNIRMGTIFINRENNKTNESHKFVLNLSQRLDIRSSDKLAALQNLSIYYTWKNIRKQYKNNKLKIIAPTWNDEFELPEDYIEFIIKKHETLTTIPPIHAYINRIHNILMFQIKDGYKLEL